MGASWANITLVMVQMDQANALGNVMAERLVYYGRKEEMYSYSYRVKIC